MKTGLSGATMLDQLSSIVPEPSIKPRRRWWSPKRRVLPASATEVADGQNVHCARRQLPKRDRAKGGATLAATAEASRSRKCRSGGAFEQ